VVPLYTLVKIILLLYKKITKISKKNAIIAFFLTKVCKNSVNKQVKTDLKGSFERFLSLLNPLSALISRCFFLLLKNGYPPFYPFARKKLTLLTFYTPQKTLRLYSPKSHFDSSCGKTAILSRYVQLRDDLEREKL
jgi:hypothetical protein